VSLYSFPNSKYSCWFSPISLHDSQ
jgi:hypothetical protein